MVILRETGQTIRGGSPFSARLMNGERPVGDLVFPPTTEAYRTRSIAPNPELTLTNRPPLPSDKESMATG